MKLLERSFGNPAVCNPVYSPNPSTGGRQKSLHMLIDPGLATRTFNGSVLQNEELTRPYRSFPLNSGEQHVCPRREKPNLYILVLVYCLYGADVLLQSLLPFGSIVSFFFFFLLWVSSAVVVVVCDVDVRIAGNVHGGRATFTHDLSTIKPSFISILSVFFFFFFWFIVAYYPAWTGSTLSQLSSE